MKRVHRALPWLALLLVSTTSSCIIHITTDGVSGMTGLRRWSHSKGSGPRVVGNGVRATEARQVDTFHALVLEGAIDVNVSVGDEHGVSLSGDENLLSHVRTWVEDGALHVDMAEGSYSSRRALVLEASTAELRSVDLLASSDVDITGLRGDFTGTLKGSGDLTASGAVDRLELRLSGSGDIDFERVQARECVVSVQGSGDVEVDASERLEATISGSGDLRYSGRPETSIQVRGSGSVRPSHD